MGAAVGQVPEYIEMVTRWCKHYSRLPVIVKLTPNITDIRYPARAAKKGGADAVSLINTINSIIGVDLETMSMRPNTGGKGSHGGYCGPAVKPIALNMVAEIARAPETAGLPISGIGGIATWHDAAEFIALGCGNVQVCTAAMVYGFRIVEDIISGLSNFMDEKGYRHIADFQGNAIKTVTDWRYLNLNHIDKAVIDQQRCIKCGRCHIACEDTSHQAITAWKEGVAHYEVIDENCVGCKLMRFNLPGSQLHHPAQPEARRNRPAYGKNSQRRIRQLDNASQQPGQNELVLHGRPAQGRLKTAPLPICQFQTCAMQLRDALHDRQAEATSFGGRRRSSVKTFGQTR